MCQPSRVRDRLHGLPDDRLAWLAARSVARAGQADDPATREMLAGLADAAVDEISERGQLRAVTDILREFSLLAR